MHLSPAGFPPDIPGMGEEMDGTIQQAPQFGRQFMLMVIDYLVCGFLFSGFCLAGPAVLQVVQV